MKGRNPTTQTGKATIGTGSAAPGPAARREMWGNHELLTEWEIFIDLEKHGSLFKSVVMLESLMDENDEIESLYKNLIPTLKSYSVDEIVVESIRLAKLNNLTEAANLIEFAVVCDAEVKSEYAYRLSLRKQNMRMLFKRTDKIKQDAIDYAIDLGTTDSVISYFNNGNPIIIKNHRTGDDFTPSAVSLGIFTYK